MCLGIFFNIGTSTIHAEEISTKEDPIIENRESDWPDYNYGNWQEVANNPELYSQVLQCLVEAGITNAPDIVAGLTGPITFLSIMLTFGIGVAWDVSVCMLTQY